MTPTLPFYQDFRVTHDYAMLVSAFEDKLMVVDMCGDQSAHFDEVLKREAATGGTAWEDREFEDMFEGMFRTVRLQI